MVQQKYKRGKTNETGEGENKRRNEGERKRGRKNSKKSEGKKEIQAQMVVRLYRTSGAAERMEALYEEDFQDVEVGTS